LLVILVCWLMQEVVETYEDVLFEFSKEAYQHELERKAHFTTWLGLYLTVLSVLVGLLFKGVNSEWLFQYGHPAEMSYLGATIGGLVSAFVGAFYFIRAFRFYRYKYLENTGQYARWMNDYIAKNNIDTTKHMDFLRQTQIRAMSQRLSEAIKHNRKLNDNRMGYLESCKNWALWGYVFLLGQHLLILFIDILGVYENAR